MCISQNNLYKQHHTMDYLQKPVVHFKAFSSSLKSKYYVN